MSTFVYLFRVPIPKLWIEMGKVHEKLESVLSKSTTELRLTGSGSSPRVQSGYYASGPDPYENPDLDMTLKKTGSGTDKNWTLHFFLSQYFKIKIGI